MGNVVIVAACRTAVGALGGMYKTITSLDLSIPIMQELVKRSGIDPEIIEDVIWGCNYQRTYKENNLARVAAIKAGLPESVPGITIHRNCTAKSMPWICKTLRTSKPTPPSMMKKQAITKWVQNWAMTF